MIILKINSCSDCTCVQISSLVMSGYMQSTVSFKCIFEAAVCLI